MLPEQQCLHEVIFQYVRITLNLSSLTNMKKFTSNFRQSVQICCREKEREENNGNCKAFSLNANAKSRCKKHVTSLQGKKSSKLYFWAFYVKHLKAHSSIRLHFIA